MKAIHVTNDTAFEKVLQVNIVCLSPHGTSFIHSNVPKQFLRRIFKIYGDFGSRRYLRKFLSCGNVINYKTCSTIIPIYPLSRQAEKQNPGSAPVSMYVENLGSFSSSNFMQPVE